jgi:hypothetical protein
MSDWARGSWNWDGFSNDSEQGALAGIEHLASVKFDNNREHIVMLQQVGERLGMFYDPCKKEGIGSKTRKYSKHSVGRRCAFFVTHNKLQHLSIWTGQSATLNWFRVTSVFEYAESATEAILFVTGLELRGIANTSHGYPAYDDRMIDRVRKHCGDSRRGKDIRGNHRVHRIFRTCEREQIGEISWRITDLTRSIYMV